MQIPRYASRTSYSSVWARRCAAAAAALLASYLVFGAAPPGLAAVNPVQVAWLGEHAPASATGVSWGVPFPPGSVTREQAFALATADGQSLPVQTWPMAYWPDGSLKWSGFAAVVPKDAKPPFTIGAADSPAAAAGLRVAEEKNAYVVNTGPLIARIGRNGANLIQSLTVEGVEVARDGKLVCILQKGAENNPEDVAPRTRYLSRIDQVTVEQSGPVRAVFKIEGMHKAVKGRRAWLPFTVRLYFYAGQAPICVVHTLVFDGDQEQDFVRGLGISFAVPLREQSQNRHVRFSGQDGGLWAEPIQPGGGIPSQQAGERLPDRPAPDPNDIEQVAIWSDYKLVQSSPDGFTIHKRTNPKSTWLFAGAGKRASGLGFVGDVSGGLAISVKDFWQSYPAMLEVRNAAAPVAELTAWLWSPEGPAMDMRHYDIRAHGLNASYEDVQPGMSTAFGVAHTSELTLYPSKGMPSKAATVTLAKQGAEPPLIVAAPAYLHSTGVFGVWSLPDRSTPLKAAVEQRLDSVLSFYQQQVDERYWYGFWVYGDFIHSYSRAAHVWYYDWGGHAWQNTELGVPLWLWYSFLRTGREDLFRLAEAQTRNTSETCVYHLGPMAGLGSRHNVVKWGCGAKEARISQSAHWRPYYYLTTDERTGDLMRATLQADIAAMKYDPMRKAQPPLPTDPKHPGRIRIGPDWFALAGNWMTEWERTGDVRWRDRILAGVDSILAMPYWIKSGVRNGLNPDLKNGGIGPLKGGGSMTVGYDPATGKLMPIPDPVAHAQVAVNYNLSTIQGGGEVMFELVPLLGRDDFRQAWLQYCRLSDAPGEVLVKDRQTGTEGADAQYVERAQGGARLAAYAYSQTKNNAFAKWAVQGLARYGGPLTIREVTGPDSLNRVHEAAFVSTNDASQASLTAIEILALCADNLPAELPPAPPFGRNRGPRAGRESTPAPESAAPEAAPDGSTSESLAPDNPASSPTANRPRTP